MRRTFPAGNPAMRAARGVRNGTWANSVSGRKPSAPESSASAKTGADPPRLDTLPRPVIATRPATGRYVTMRSVRSQRACAGFVERRHRPTTALVTALAALAIAVTVAHASAPADLFDDIYRRGQPMEQSIKTIRAHFTETTTSSLLVKPVVAEGTLLAVRPSDILLTYAKPEKKLLRIDAKTLLFVWPDKKLRQAQDIHESQARVQKYFVDKSPDELRKHFAITAAVDPARPGTWRIEMIPKRKQIQQGVTKIELWISERTSILSTMVLTFASGDTKTMAFTDIEVNPPITLADLGVPAAG